MSFTNIFVKRAYRVELDPNNKQRTLLVKAAGISRFTWNWDLAFRIKKYRENEGNDRYTDAMKQHKVLNVMKKKEFIWMREVSKCVPQEAMRDLDRAFSNFFKRTHGFPKFKKKGKSRDSFRLTGSIHVREDRKARKCKRNSKKMRKR